MAGLGTQVGTWAAWPADWASPEPVDTSIGKIATSLNLVDTVTCTEYSVHNNIFILLTPVDRVDIILINQAP